MTTKEMEEGIDFLNRVYEEDGDDVKIINDLFGELSLGDVGKVRFISKSDLDYYNARSNEYDKEYIDGMWLEDKFCIIPYPSDVQNDGDDYLIFIRGQVAGTRGEESNIVLDIRHYLQSVKNGMLFEFIKE